MNIPAIALRNIRRNWHRTLVTVLAMGMAGGIMVLYAALMEGLLHASERSAIAMNTGEVQIHAPGYRKDPDLYKRIEHPQQLISELEQAGFRATSRLYGFGLGAAGSASAGIQLRGVDMEHEARVLELPAHVMRGQWLDAAAPHEVVIGKKLARTLGVDLGGEVVVVSQGADGSMANDLYTVRGILKSVSDGIDRAGFYMSEAAFRELMVLPEGSHEIVVVSAGETDPPLSLEQKTARIQALVPDYEVNNWKQLLPVIASILESADVQIIVLILITYVAVAMVVLNAMLMSVFERIREFGLMKAMGVRPLQIVGLIVLESQYQVVLAAVLTLALGIPPAIYLETHGIDLTATASGFSFAGIAIDPTWYSLLTPNAVITPLVLLFLVALLAVIYPAAKAALIQPVKAIHYQ